MAYSNVRIKVEDWIWFQKILSIFAHDLLFVMLQYLSYVQRISYGRWRQQLANNRDEASVHILYTVWVCTSSESYFKSTSITW